MPSSAVTRTVTVLLPLTRLVLPLIVRVAAASATLAITLTEAVPAATVTMSPETTFWPFTARRLRSVLELSASTLTVKV